MEIYSGSANFCTDKNAELVKYATMGLPQQVFDRNI